MPGPYSTAGVAFRCLDHVGFLSAVLSRLDHHSLRPRCLRFAGWVTPPPRKTRFRLVANLSRAGLGTCKVHVKEFPSDCCYVISSPLPRLCLAQQDLTLILLYK